MAEETKSENQQTQPTEVEPSKKASESSNDVSQKKTSAKKKTKSKKATIAPELFSIIKYPVSTEKAIRLMESDNKLVFVVDQKANRQEIKDALEKIFNIKVEKVNTLIDRQGNKRAIARLAPESAALDVATNLGMM